MAVVKTNDLTGVQLDWAVAQCLKIDVKITSFAYNQTYLIAQKSTDVGGGEYQFCPSTDGAMGTPIIEQELLTVGPNGDIASEWVAYYVRPNACSHKRTGPTLLVAAMRCIVASFRGNEVEIPDSLCKTSNAQLTTTNIDI
jgi:hypothetical protein